MTVSPGDSIQAAVDGADSGDTIVVEGGTYHEQVTIPDEAITLVGDPGDDTPGPGPDAPVIDGQGAVRAAAFWLEDPSDAPVDIAGFAVRDFGEIPDDTWGEGVKTDARSNVTVRDCPFANLAGSGVAIHNDGGVTPENWSIRRNAFSANANSAVHPSSNDGAEIVDNVVESGDVPVGDSPDGWWEEGTDPHNPRAGIEVNATAQNGHSATLSDVVIRGNRITGTDDDTAIRVLSTNEYDPSEGDPEGTEALATDVTIRDNAIEITDELGDEERDESGILVGPHPEFGEPAYVDGVEVVDNATVGAATGVGLAAQGPTQIRSVRIEGNTLTDGIQGVSLNGHGPDTITDVEVRGNDSSGNRLGLLLFNGEPADELAGPPGSPFEDVHVTENRLVENQFVGVVAAGDRDLAGVVVHRNPSTTTATPAPSTPPPVRPARAVTSGGTRPARSRRTTATVGATPSPGTSTTSPGSPSRSRAPGTGLHAREPPAGLTAAPSALTPFRGSSTPCSSRARTSPNTSSRSGSRRSSPTAST